MHGLAAYAWACLGALFVCVVELASPNLTDGQCSLRLKYGHVCHHRGHASCKLVGSNALCLGGLPMLWCAWVLLVQVVELALPNPTNGHSLCTLSIGRPPAKAMFASKPLEVVSNRRCVDKKALMRWLVILSFRGSSGVLVCVVELALPNPTHWCSCCCSCEGGICFLMR